MKADISASETTLNTNIIPTLIDENYLGQFKA